VQLEPAKSAPLSMLASVYQSKGQVDEAIDTYKQYLDKFPNESDVTWVRSLIANLQKVSDSQKAVIASHPGADKANDYLPFCTEQSKVRWRKNHGPVKVYIQSGSGVKNFQPAFEKSLRESFSDWVTGTGGVVSVLYVSSKREADIDCLFTDNFGQVSSLAEGGETKMLYDSDGNFEHCSIVLLTAHATDTLPPSENEIRGVCLHEIGHSLGLTGHSPNASDIMYCSETDVESKRPQLSSRDLATLKKLYG
jgi:predicted Zn-dependent protease